MSKKPIDFNKPVQTVDGQAVRILCTNMNSDFPIVGIVKTKSGSEWCGLWEADGCSDVGDCWDLQNAPAQKKTGWINLYSHPPTNTWVDDAVYATVEEAKAEATGDDAIQIQIEWEE